MGGEKVQAFFFWCGGFVTPEAGQILEYGVCCAHETNLRELLRGKNLRLHSYCCYFHYHTTSKEREVDISYPHNNCNGLS